MTTFNVGDSVSFDYPDSKTGVVSNRTGIVAPANKSHEKVNGLVFLSLGDGKFKSFKTIKMTNVKMVGL